MANHGHTSESEVKHPRDLIAAVLFMRDRLIQPVLAGVLIVGTGLKWLADLILPTADDLIEADVYLGPMHD